MTRPTSRDLSCTPFMRLRRESCCGPGCVCEAGMDFITSCIASTDVAPLKGQPSRKAGHLAAASAAAELGTEAGGDGKWGREEGEVAGGADASDGTG